MKKVWEKPELKDVVKGIETVFIWNSVEPEYKPWNEPQPQQSSIINKIGGFFIPKKGVTSWNG